MTMFLKNPAAVGPRRHLGVALGSLLLLSGVQAEEAKSVVDDASGNLPSANALLSATTKLALDDDPVAATSKKQRRARKEEHAKRQKKAVQERREYPVPPVTYQPSLPPVGKYSVAGICEPIHESTAPSITLNDGESLASAYARLQSASNNQGGVINIPWNVRLNQCDSLRVARKRIMSGGVTIRGLPGPNGEQPRFYCRTEKRDGTVPHSEVAGRFMSFGDTRKDGKGSPANQRVLVENLHVDGYKTAFNLPKSGHIILRNNYVHHQFGNAVVYSNLEWPARLTLEICGNEVAHAGYGNALHGFYLHRGLHPESSAEIALVDNLCHSTPYSSCFKSIANKHVVKGNRFYQSLDTDPSYEKRYSSMLLDIAACADNLIEDNEFHGHKPEANKFGDILIGIRNRKKIVKGCDRPPYDSSQFNDPDYWSSLGGAKVFPTIIKRNSFTAGPDFGERLFAITAMGTFPNEELRGFGPAKLLEPPPGWYERSRVYVSENTYTGFAADHLYRSLPPGHCSVEKCGPPPAREPDSDLIEVGKGETYVK